MCGCGLPLTLAILDQQRRIIPPQFAYGMESAPVTPLRAGTEWPKSVISNSTLGVCVKFVEQFSGNGIDRIPFPSHGDTRVADAVCELLQLLGAGVLVADPAGRVVYANAQAEHMLGNRVERLLGRSIMEALIEADFDLAGSKYPTLRSPGDSRFVVQVESRRAGYASLEIRISPLPERIAGKGAELYEIYDISDTQRHTRQLLHDATHDPLTGLANRRALTERLAECTRWESSPGAETVLAMLDLDGFKQINDTLGHSAGDEVLQDVARLLQAHTRRADMAVRLGGDEFVVLLIDCGLQESVDLLTAIKEQVDDYRYATDGQEFGLSVSIGVAPIEGAGTTAADLLSRADKACYQAKYAGGNRIVVDSASASSLNRSGARLIAAQSNLLGA